MNAELQSFQMPSGNTIAQDSGSSEHGFSSSCYVKQSDGTVWCWGDNNAYSQLGIGISNIQTSDLKKVVGLQHIQQISMSDFSACAIQSDFVIVTGKQIGRASCRERVCLYV